MGTNEETLYENKKNENQESILESPANVDNDPANMKKRFAALGGTILAGGIGGATLASILRTKGSIEETEDVFKIIDEGDELTFEEAFNNAREQLGPGGAFRWHGGVYHTYTEEEWANMSQEERDSYNEKVRPLLSEEEQNGENYYRIHHASNHENEVEVTKAVHNKEVFNIENESVTELDGRTVVVATGTHNGKPMVLVDMNRDGTYDIMVEDSNGDGNIADNEYVDVRTQNISVGDQTLLAVRASHVNDEWLIIEEGETELDGQKVIVAIAEHNGQRAVLIDADRNGAYDFAMEDRNHDGKLSEDDIYDVSQQRITVQDRSLITEDVAHNEDPVVEVDYSTEARVQIDEEGHEVIGAAGTVDGQPAMLLDVNRDGSYDRAFIKVGEEIGEPINIASAHARVNDISLLESDIEDTHDYAHHTAEEDNTEVKSENETNRDVEDTVEPGRNPAIDDYTYMAYEEDSTMGPTDPITDDYSMAT